jgi:hypothetical protein
MPRHRIDPALLRQPRLAPRQDRLVRMQGNAVSLHCKTGMRRTSD